MKKRTILDSLKRFLKLIYIKLFRINDTPQKIAQGAGIGVFLGILPGTGPIAAVFMAFVLRANRAAAFLGGLLTNTWLSVVTFLLAIKIGSWLMGISWQAAHHDLMLVLKNFHFKTLLNFSIFKIISPLLIGYLIVSFCLGLIVYLVTWIVIKNLRKD
ncbi:MAG: DUF2062 domain-containing protein [Candidatus Omnitrophota bacterium]